MNPADNAAIQLDHVSVVVPDGTEALTILESVNLSVAPGEVLMVTGASGSGKSTLLAVAALLRQPNSGSVSIDGVDTAGMKRTAPPGSEASASAWCSSRPTCSRR